MARPNKHSLVAGPGDTDLHRIGAVLSAGPMIRPGFIPLRVTDLDTTNSPARPAVTPRVNPDYDFLLTRILGYCEALAAETTLAVQHAFFNARVSGENSDLFDDPLCLAHFCISTADGTGPSAVGGPASGLELPWPRLIDAGKNITAEFTAEAGFGALDKVVDVTLVGTYIDKDLDIEDAMAVIEELKRRRNR